MERIGGEREGAKEKIHVVKYLRKSRNQYPILVHLPMAKTAIAMA